MRVWRMNLIHMVVGTTLAGLSLLCGCQWGQPEVEPISYELEQWKYGRWAGCKLTTDHYVIYTTVTDSLLIETFPELVERSYENYQKLVSSAHAPTERMRVYLFELRGQWAHMTKRLTGPRAEVFMKIRNGGFSHEGVSNIQYVSHAVTFPLLAHEGFHQYLHHCVHPAIPAWLNEGLAVVSEGQRWAGVQLKTFDPWYNPNRINRLADAVSRDRLYSLKEILGTHAGKVVHETSTKVGTYYAQVWALMLFLWEGENGKYAERFERLRQALSSPDLEQRMRAEEIWSQQGTVSRGEALFRSFITDDLKTFEREYVTFLRKRLLNEH